MFETLEKAEEAFAKLSEEYDNARLELEALKEDRKKDIENEKKVKEELEATKKLNFQLANRLDVRGPKKSDEEILADMFGWK